MKTTHSALRSGLLTGLSTLAVSGSAAGAGLLLAHEFGRNARTDGFFLAYGVYLVIVIAAQSFRTVVLPDLTRAAARGALGLELRAYALALAVPAVPAVALAAALAGPLGHAITGRAAAAHVAARALPWLVAAGFLQLFAALLASALAALDDYVVAAVAYAAGGVLALALFAGLAHPYGIVSLAWSVAANGALTAALPLAALARRAALAGARSEGLALARRLGALVGGASVPIALQAMYVVSLRIAGGLGAGRASSFNYAYLVAAVLVTATASSVALISSAPLTRRGLDAEAAAAHVAHAAWLSLAPIGAAAGFFALAGGRILGPLLGSSYGGGVGRELGRLVAYLAPWTVVTVAYTVTFPLLFVLGRGRARALVAVAGLGLALSIPLALAGRAALGLGGISLALAVSTLAVLVALARALGATALRIVLRELAAVAALYGAVAAAAFAAGWAIGGVGGAVAGVVLYGVALLALRPRPLRAAWGYVRGLH